MSNFSLSVNLKKLKNTFVTDFQGRESKKRVICIPIEDNFIYETDNGGIHLNLSAFEYKEKKFNDTHMLKVSIKKEVLEAMSEEERNNLPIVGGLKPFVAKSENSTVVKLSKEETDDLPF